MTVDRDSEPIDCGLVPLVHKYSCELAGSPKTELDLTNPGCSPPPVSDRELLTKTPGNQDSRVVECDGPSTPSAGRCGCSCPDIAPVSPGVTCCRSVCTMMASQTSRMHGVDTATVSGVTPAVDVGVGGVGVGGVGPAVNIADVGVGEVVEVSPLGVPS